MNRLSDTDPAVAERGASSLVLVTGGTGTLGRLVIPRLRAAGSPVRVLSRRARDHHDSVEYVVGDLEKDEGVEAALEGACVVVHCAGTQKGDETKARNLLKAASRGGVRHVVFISVVGAERIPIASRGDRAMFGYFGAKLGAEEAVAESGIPWTTLRATQFHDLILTTVQQMTRMPVVPAPAGMRFQPVEADEVAARLVELALGPPAGLVPEFGGPRAYELRELVRGYLRASGKHRPLVPVRLPGKAASAVRAGANLPRDGAVGRRTWEEFLAARVG